MIGLHGIAYTSIAHPMTAEELTAMLEDARRFNAEHGVSGVLLHHAGTFFQYFEGPRTAVREVQARILASPRHHSIHMVLDMPLAIRHFDGWHMGFCEPPENEFQAIANAEWAGAIPLTRATMERSEPLSLVLSYWSRWVADQPGRQD